MAFKDVREFLNLLRKEKEIIEIEEEISPLHDGGAILRAVGEKEGPAILFHKIKGYPCKATGNLLGSYKRVALAFGCPQESLADEYLRRKRGSIPPLVLDSGPVKEVILKGNIDIMKVLPIFTYHERDIGPYLTSAATIAKDPDTGTLSMGLHRLQLHSDNTFSCLLATPPLSVYLARAEELNEPLEVAIAIGMDPMVVFSSVIWTPDRPAKFDIAGALRKEPVPLVKAETVDLEVPAYAEAVIEGKIMPGVRRKDGPFGESTGYYLAYESPVVEITAVTHRSDFIFHALCPWVMEDDILMVLSIGREIFRQIKNLVPPLRDISFMPGTCGLHAVLSMDYKRRPGEIKRALYLALTINPIIKRAVAVDPDVDIYNMREVEWAMATRFQPDKDMIILHDCPGLGIDPSITSDHLSSKIGIDATKDPARPELFEKIDMPKVSKELAKKILSKYGWKG